MTQMGQTDELQNLNFLILFLSNLSAVLGKLSSLYVIMGKEHLEEFVFVFE